MKKLMIGLAATCLLAVFAYSGWDYQNGRMIWSEMATDATCFLRDGLLNIYPCQPAVYENTIHEFDGTNAVVRCGYWGVDTSGDFYPVVALTDYNHRGESGYRWDCNWDVDSSGNVYPK